MKVLCRALSYMLALLLALMPAAAVSASVDSAPYPLQDQILDSPLPWDQDFFSDNVIEEDSSETGFSENTNQDNLIYEGDEWADTWNGLSDDQNIWADTQNDLSDDQDNNQAEEQSVPSDDASQGNSNQAEVVPQFTDPSSEAAQITDDSYDNTAGSAAQDTSTPGEDFGAPDDFHGVLNGSSADHETSSEETEETFDNVSEDSNASVPVNDNLSGGTAQNQEELPQDTAQDPEGLPQDDSAQDPENLPQDDSALIPEKLPQDDSAQVPEELPQDDSAQDPENLPQDDSAQDPEGLPQDDSAQDPENLPQDTAQIPDGLSQDINSDEIILEEEGDEEVFTPVENGEPDTDNEDVFASYVNRELELSDTAGTAAGNPSGAARKALRKSQYAGSRLSYYNRILYDLLLEKVQKTAAGENQNTIFTITPQELTGGQTWSASDLGVNSIVIVNPDGSKQINSEARAALKSLLDLSFVSVVKSLLADCPYDLYWYDKTASSTATGFSYAASIIDGEYRLYLSKVYTARLPVSAGYSATGESNTYEVNTDTGASVRQAYNNARSIVAQYSDCTDYEKLDGYRQEICARTSYNYAVPGRAAYGDPWQLIWVLDDDRTNQVVCEGYAKAFQYLCDLTEFHDIVRECISVSGYLGDPADIAALMAGGSSSDAQMLKDKGHMWNVVELTDGRNFLVDITNCDKNMMGSGRNGRNLFLIGTGPSGASGVYASGSVRDGYRFNINSTGPGYVYDDAAFARFGEEILTLSEGRVEGSVPEVEGAVPAHTHIFLPVSEVPSSCTVQGHNSYWTCETCGSGSEQSVWYPLASHKAGTWTRSKNPTYETTGTDTSSCTVCGKTLTRSVPKLVHVTGISFPTVKASVSCRKTLSLTAAALPAGAYNKKILWSSTDKHIASVNSSGVVTGVRPGVCTVNAVTEDGAYKASCVVTVNALPINKTTVSLSIPGGRFVYDGKAKIPVVSVVDSKGTALIKGTDYTVTCSGNVNAGTNTAALKVTGKGIYSGSVSRTFSISKAVQPLTAKITSSRAAAGKTVQITVSGAKGKKTFTSSDTKTAVVSSSGLVTARKPGKVIITVKAAGTANYLSAAKTLSVSIVPAAATSFKAINQAGSIKLTWAKVTGATGYYIYRGDIKRGDIKIKTITSGSTITCTDSGAVKNGTKYTYKLIARGTEGISPLYRTVTIYRLFRPAAPSLASKSAGAVTVSWIKNDSASGYQIQLSRSSTLPPVKQVNVNGASSIKKTVSGLYRNRTYYARIRAFRKTSDNKYFYSSWSAAKKIIVK